MNVKACARPAAALFLLLIFFLALPRPVDAQEEREWKPRRFFCKQDAPPGKKILRGEIISFTLQGLGYAQLALMPASKTGWEFKNTGRNYRWAFTKPPVWDGDNWLFNYLGHPLTGSLHYNILRSQDAPILHSFLYSTAQSLIWEYAMEASVERPSIQDLLFTSTIGSVIGELAHLATLAMKKNKFRTIEKITVTLINPMYVLNNGYRPTQEKTRWLR